MGPPFARSERGSRRTSEKEKERMPTIPVGPTLKPETPEQKASWRALRKLIRDQRLVTGATFYLPGRVLRLEGDPDTGMPKVVENTFPGAKSKTRKVLTAVAVPAEPALKECLFYKDLGASLMMPLSGLAKLYVAVNGEMPPKTLTSFDTDELCEEPVTLVLTYKGERDEDDERYGRKANLKVYLTGFLSPQDATPVAVEDEEKLPWEEA